MTDSKDTAKNAKDKIAGGAKETVGKVTGNEELELKGKIQSTKGDIGDKVDEIKESVAGKINDIIDKKKDDKEKK